MLVIAPQKFCLLFTLGSLLIIGSFSALKGPREFCAHLFELKRLPFSLLYAGSLVGTLWATLIAKSALYTLVLCLAQIAALLQFLGSYFPGGPALVRSAI